MDMDMDRHGGASLPLSAAVALTLVTGGALVARRCSAAAGELGVWEFALAAAALLAALALALLARATGPGLSGVRERFETVAEAVSERLAKSFDALIKAYEGAADDGKSEGGSDLDDREDVAEEDEVDIDAVRYAGDPEVGADPARLAAVQLQYKRAQLLLCRLKGYDADIYGQVVANARRLARLGQNK